MMRIFFKSIIYIVLIIFIGCENPKGEEAILYGEFNNSTELLKTGIWYAINPYDGDTLQIGKYKNGFKDGSWKYFYTNKTFTINWKVVQGNNIKINIPENWRTKVVEPFLFYSVKDTLKGFNIIRTKSTKLNDYLERYFNEIKGLSDARLSSLTFQKEIIQDSIVFYSGSFSYLNKNKYPILCLVTIFEYGGDIYDCTYFVKNKSKATFIDEIVKESIVTSIFINNKQIIIIPTVLSAEKLSFDKNNNWLK